MWTKEKPKQAGWYWWRNDPEPGYTPTPEPSLIIAIGTAWWRGDNNRIIADGDGEWWSERIQEPVDRRQSNVD